MSFKFQAHLFAHTGAHATQPSAFTGMNFMSTKQYLNSPQESLYNIKTLNISNLKVKFILKSHYKVQPKTIRRIHYILKELVN